MGRSIKVLYDGIKSAGKYNQTWNGIDNAGNTVGAGVYFYRMFTPHNVFMQKMVLMK